MQWREAGAPAKLVHIFRTVVSEGPTMNSNPFVPSLALLLMVGASSSHGGDQPVDPDEALLQEAGVGADGAALLDYVRTNTGSDDDLLKLDRLVEQLGSDEFKQREEASAKLVKLGLVALPALRRAKVSDDAEVRRRATDGVDQVLKQYRPGLPLAAVRKLLQFQPDGTVAALVRYLPYAGDEAVEEEIYFGVYDLTKAKKSVEPALTTAMSDKPSARRALAACVVGRLGDSDERKAARKLLDDADPTVRLRAAQGLLAAKDKESLPTLVALLEAQPVSVAWQAEELLHWAAGDDAPEAIVGAGGDKAQAKCRKAWQAWLENKSYKLDLINSDEEPRRPGLMLVCERALYDAVLYRFLPDQVSIYGCDGKPRWRLSDLDKPEDARLLSDERVLLAEHEPGRVTERGFDGKVLWKKDVKQPAACERFPNGNTFIAHFDATEITPEGEVIYSQTLKSRVGGVDQLAHCTQPLCHGRILGVVAGAVGPFLLVEFDRGDCRECRSVNTPGVGRTGAVEGLPGGGFLVCRGFVHETNAKGTPVLTLRFAANHAVRLRNGNTLLSNGTTGSGSLVEIDPDGKVQWEALTGGMPVRARVCLGLVRLGFDAPRPAGLDLYSIPYRIKGLHSNDPERRMRSVVAIGELGADAAEAIPDLIETLDDPDVKTTSEAASALAKMGPSKVLPTLVKALADKRPKVRAGAVSSLSELRGSAASAYPALLKLRSDESAEVRRSLLPALVFINPDGEEVVPSLLAGLEDSAKEVRDEAVAMLRVRKRAAEAAVPALLKWLKGKDADQRSLAAFALANIAPTDGRVLKALLDMAKETEDSEKCFLAACALAEMHPAPPGAAEAMAGALRAASRISDPDKAQTALQSLLSAAWNLRTGAKPLAPALTELVKNKKLDRLVRGLAIERLGKMGKDAVDAVPTLTEVADDDDFPLNVTAQEALKKIKR
jgi:HEAT repeat protein